MSMKCGPSRKTLRDERPCRQRCPYGIVTLCIGVADMMARKTRSFAGKWKLRIFSPYSGKHPTAICNLR